MRTHFECEHMLNAKQENKYWMLCIYVADKSICFESVQVNTYIKFNTTIQQVFGCNQNIFPHSLSNDFSSRVGISYVPHQQSTIYRTENEH